MDIEAIVKKYKEDAPLCSYDFDQSDAETMLSAALTELAAGYENRIIALNREVVEANERIRQLEADNEEYDRRIVAVGGVAINSVSREYHDAEVARLNALYAAQADRIAALEAQLSASREREGRLREAARKSKSLASVALWIAYVWNDHNFNPAHECAKAEARLHDLDCLEDAQDFLAEVAALAAEEGR